MAEPGSRSFDAGDCIAECVGMVGDDEAVHAVFDELRGRVVGSRDDDRRRPARKSFENDEPVALASGGENQAERMTERALSSVSSSTKPGASTRPSRRCSAMAANTFERSGPSP